MAERLDPKQTTDAQELIVTLVYAQDALVRVLQRKGILTEHEVLEEIKQVRIEQEKKGRGVSH